MDPLNGIDASNTGLANTARTQQESNSMDKQTFGAAVVSETLNQMNTNSSGQMDANYDFQTKVLGASAGVGTPDTSTIAVTDKETFGAAVVSSTLEAMNTDASGKTDSDYDFQTKVLGAYAGSGTIVDTKS